MTLTLTITILYKFSNKTKHLIFWYLLKPAGVQMKTFQQSVMVQSGSIISINLTAHTQWLYYTTAIPSISSKCLFSLATLNSSNLRVGDLINNFSLT